VGWGSYVVDIIWVLLLLHRFLEECHEIWKHWSQLGCVQGSVEYIDLSNAVDWLNILFANVVIILWAILVSKTSSLVEILATRDARVPGAWAHKGDLEDFYETVDMLVHEDHIFRAILAAYPFVTMARFFKACAAQPRLAVVTKTFERASTAIFHFGVVFFTVFIVFAAAAVTLWGEENVDFANFPRALHTTFRLLLGDFDWEELHDIGRPQAYIWFWSFNWLVNLIMLNMLLAIVLDEYGQVKTGIGSSATLWSQSYEIYDRKRKVFRGEAKALSEVLHKLDPTELDEDDNESDETIWVETLVKQYHLKEKQAFEILYEAQKMAEQEALLNDDADVPYKLMIINRKVTQMHKFLEESQRAGQAANLEQRKKASEEAATKQQGEGGLSFLCGA